MSQQSFRELGVSAPVADALAARSIDEPFTIQTLVLPDALAGLDILAKSPTGSGKTLAFAIPIVERTQPEGPPPERARPRSDARARAAGDRRARRDRAPRKDSRSRRSTAACRSAPRRSAPRSAHVLVATPGRLRGPCSIGVCSTSTRIRILVLDEADRMLDMGFQPQVDRIVRRLPRNRQTMFFSATLDGEVGRARAQVHEQRRRASRPGYRRIARRARSSTGSSRWRTTRKSRRSSSTSGRGRPERSSSCGRSAAPTGSSASSAPRQSTPSPCTATCRSRARNVRSSASRAATCRTLVATDVAARGLDIERHRPRHQLRSARRSTRSYVHRTGRTGRAGNDGTAVTFVLPEQQAETEPRGEPPRAPSAIRRRGAPPGATAARVCRPPARQVEVVGSRRV